MHLPVFTDTSLPPLYILLHLHPDAGRTFKLYGTNVALLYVTLHRVQWLYTRIFTYIYSSCVSKGREKEIILPGYFNSTYSSIYVPAKASCKCTYIVPRYVFCGKDVTTQGRWFVSTYILRRVYRYMYYPGSPYGLCMPVQILYHRWRKAIQGWT